MDRRREMVRLVVADKKLWLPEPYITELENLAEVLRVPSRRDVIENFVAAYCVIRGLMNATTADRVVASSSKGRRHWERKIREAETGTSRLKANSVSK